MKPASFPLAVAVVPWLLSWLPGQVPAPRQAWYFEVTFMH
jgi:hypothetical protein